MTIASSSGRVGLPATAGGPSSIADQGVQPGLRSGPRSTTSKGGMLRRSAAKLWPLNSSRETMSLMPESAIRYASSSRFDQVLNATITAPAMAAPKNVATHSGRLFISSPIRSPRLMPRAAKNDAIRAARSAKVA